MADWRERAACRDESTLLWFLGNDPFENAEAKQVCGGCPVRDECLEHAMDSRERDGIWGGLTGDERKTLARRRGYARGKARETARG